MLCLLLSKKDLSSKWKVRIAKVHYVEAVDTMGAGDSFLAAFVKTLYELGWQKGEVITSAKAEKALQAASEYSSINCLNGGAFGYEILDDEKE